MSITISTRTRHWIRSWTSWIQSALCSLRSILILLFHHGVVLTRSLFPLDFRHNSVSVSHFACVCFMLRPSHPPGFITITISGEDYTLLSYLLRNCRHPLVYLLGRNILLSILFSNILNPCPSLAWEIKFHIKNLEHSKKAQGINYRRVKWNILRIMVCYILKDQKEKSVAKEGLCSYTSERILKWMGGVRCSVSEHLNIYFLYTSIMKGRSITSTKMGFSILKPNKPGSVTLSAK
jgi:hypothetical protein